MEKLSKEQIQNIGKNILQESDIVANHGTSIENGLSILETGFNFNRTSMVFHESDDVISLCTYGWKENEAGNAANIIISIPKEFYMLLLDYDEETYKAWIKNVKANHMQSQLINSVSEFEYTNGPFFRATVPKEFIKGMFVYTDNKTSFSFDNKEEAMNYLTYIDNKHYFTNLSDEEKFEFVSTMRNKIFSEKQNKSHK